MLSKLAYERNGTGYLTKAIQFDGVPPKDYEFSFGGIVRLITTNAEYELDGGYQIIYVDLEDEKSISFEEQERLLRQAGFVEEVTI